MIYLDLNHIARPLELWVGDPAVSNVDPNEVQSLQADGDELMDILLNTVNLPHTTSSVQRWWGDTARLIFFSFQQRNASRRVRSQIK